MSRGWKRALSGDAVDWDQLFSGYVAAVDWPASMFWRELSEANPGALVILSVRDTPEGWAPICRQLGVPAPDEPFPWIDGRNTKAT